MANPQKPNPADYLSRMRNLFLRMSGIVICSIFGTDSFQLIAFTKVLPLDSGRVRGSNEMKASPIRLGDNEAVERVAMKWPKVLLAAKTDGSVFYDKSPPSIARGKW